MLELIKKVDDYLVKQILEYSREVYSKNGFKKDISNYSKDRLIFWVCVEANLYKSNNPFKKAFVHKELFILLKKIIPEADLFLIHFGKGINPHRDASSLNKEAFGLQIQGEARFLYASENKDIDSFLELKQGDLFSFNSKHLHGSDNISQDRLAINAWKINEKDRDKYIEILKNIL